jgi:hypothetical protein
MSNQFPAQTKVRPSFDEPEFLAQWSQASGAFDLLSDNKTRVRLSPGDLFVYINGVKVRTEQVTGQAAGNLLPSASIIGEYYSTPAYLVRSRAIYGHHDIQAAGNYAIALPQAQDFALDQGIYNQMRSMLLYGYNPVNGEGLANTPGAIAVNLPADSQGNTGITNYDNGELAEWFLQQILDLQNGMYQSGFGIKDRVVICGPQRILRYMQRVAIVSVVSYQRPGAGTETVAGVMQNTAELAGPIEWNYDDTMIGKGSGGADLVIMTTPELKTPRGTPYNTNMFGEIEPQMRAVNLMYADLPKPLKIPTPVEDGAISVLKEIRVTSGWCVRPQGTYLLSIPLAN